MKDPIKFIDIHNYKSIDHIHLDCKRINVFIGKPNVGKSNILEAISLLAPEYLLSRQPENKFGKSIIRYESFDQLFPFKDTSKQIVISTNKSEASISFFYNEKLSIYRIADTIGISNNIFKIDHEFQTVGEILNYYNRVKNDPKLDSELNNIQHFSIIDMDGVFSLTDKLPYHNDIKKYDFKKYTKDNHSYSRFQEYLLPPNGENLLAVIEKLPLLMETFQDTFEEYDLKLYINKINAAVDTLGLLRISGNYIYQLPLFLIADTLQRMLFYYTAIASNRDSVLLFEEPEAHSFPLYVKDLTQKIVEDKNNQYFINTHSPFVLNTILEGADFSEIAIFKVDYKNHQTTVSLIEEDFLRDMVDYGYDVFYNLDSNGKE